MAVIVSNGDTNLSTASGFYAAEAYNVGLNHSTTLALTTARYISVTFAAAGDCQGIILCIKATSFDYDRSVVVTLQENSGGWTDRAVVTYTAADLVGDHKNPGNFIIPFTGGTFPYTVTTAASTWRFKIEQTGGTDGTLYLRTSDGTNPFYVTWCDNAATFANDDCIICKDVVTIDQTASIKGVLGTGDTATGTAGVVCRSTDLTDANVCKLRWENPPVASYTFTVDGGITVSDYGGIQCGTSDDVISIAEKADWYFTARTVGTQPSGFWQVRLQAASNWYGKQYFYFYGEEPSVRATTLSQAESSGQKIIHTTDTTGWAAGDLLAIGRKTAAGYDDTVYEIDSISDKEITLTDNVAADRASEAAVIKLTGYGIRMRADASNSGALSIMANKMYFQGIEFVDVYFQCQQTISNMSTAADASSYRDTWTNKNCTARSASSSYTLWGYMNIFPEGVIVDGIYSHYTNQIYRIDTFYSAAISSGSLTYQNNIALNVNYGGAAPFWGVNGSLVSNFEFIVQDNKFENSSKQCIALGGVNTVFKNNYFWGVSNTGSYGAVYVLNLIKPNDMGNNYYDLCDVAVCFGAYSSVRAIEYDSVFGSISANTSDISMLPAAFIGYEFASPTGSLVVDDSNLSTLVDGSALKISNDNDTDRDNYVYEKYGKMKSTGTGLTDTTVHTAGGFALRFEPTSSTDNLEWEFTIPTGNIQTKTMMVGVWCKINSATYYAGTHQLPRITIDYDNGSAGYAQAAETTEWQFLSLPFTPTTTYGQITVTLSARTDATTTDAYVYWDDFATLYPAEAPLNAQTFDLWANALPVTPPIATVLSANDVWAASMSSNVGTGTTGAKLNSIKNQVLQIGPLQI